MRQKAKWVATLSACVVAGTVVGCGDEDEPAADKKKPQYSAASEAPRVFATRLARLLATSTTEKDCAQMKAINTRSVTALQCPASKKFRNGMRSFKVLGAAEYGTAAVVDYKIDRYDEPEALLLYVAADRNWGVGRLGVVTDPSVGTSDRAHRDQYDRTVSDYLRAVREQDCRTFDRVAFTGEAEGRAACKGGLPATKPLADRLEQDASARPKYLGGNDTYGFYSLETNRPKPENSTISVVRGESDGKPVYVVLDVATSPTAADQSRAIAKATAAQDGPQASKSRKAD